MNEELINQLVSRILSEPAFQALLHGNKEEPNVVKPDGLVLLNYVPDFGRVLSTLKQCYGSDYTLSILPSDQVFVAKSDLPEGMSWITPQDAFEKTTWQTIILATCSPNTLAKAALGIRDNPISEILGRGISQGIPTLLVTEYLGFTAQTPKPYHALYEGYLQMLRSYGVSVSATLGEGGTSTVDKSLGRMASIEQRLASDEQQTPSSNQKNTSKEQKAPVREAIRYDKKFLGDKQVYGIPEGSCVLVKRGTVISPLARDTLKSRRIELRQETEEGR